MDKTLSLEEILIEVQPFSDGLKQWCRDHPDFTKALKIIYPNKFITMGMVVVTHPPHCPNDKVIGFYIYHYSLKNPMFKQDFIVDVGKQDNNFVLYTRQGLVPQNSYIKDINDFFSNYGRDGNYLRAHHVSFEDIPDEGKPRALQAMALGDRVKSGGGFKNLDAEALIKANEGLKALKDSDNIDPIWQKIRNGHN
jgi:hypothetical protein